ncbi:hypothetical protein [Azospirillum soli]|uniref:hypothetical protein n=1 Tax=Azospirillum soli TaxID=1304799 RepID=UPI001AE10CE3|nr:hypothetical protein [Azospirillum soli]MBP2315860.1 hypothetical protein [Azospirillum soli]
MSGSTSILLKRLTANGKFWLKRAHIDPRHRMAEMGEGEPLFDIRIEDGLIRAVLPAGGAPCCAPGLDLDGGAVAPLHGQGRIGPGQPADLTLTTPQGWRMDMQGGQMVAAP